MVLLFFFQLNFYFLLPKKIFSLYIAWASLVMECFGLEVLGKMKLNTPNAIRTSKCYMLSLSALRVQNFITPCFHSSILVPDEMGRSHPIDKLTCPTAN